MERGRRGELRNQTANDLYYLSHFIQVNGIVHLAGQIGLVPGTMQLVEGGAEAEARLSLRHAFRALEAVGTGAKEIVQVSGTGNPDLLRFVQWREFRNLSETALTPRKAIASLLLLKDNT